MTDIVLFGVSGDLARQKLIASLFRLYKAGSTDKNAQFIGFGRKVFNKKEFSAYIARCVPLRETADLTMLKKYAAKWQYVQSEIDDMAGYKKLAALLKGDALIYLSLPPHFQMPVTKMLIDSGVVSKASERKIAYEKPFGESGAEAKKLQSYIVKHLSVDQILRVDHYAGKQALIDLEKTAGLGVLRAFLNRDSVACIDVRIHEENTAAGRGAFYDSVGALYDVGQNHILHILASILAIPLMDAKACISGTCIVAPHVASQIESEKNPPINMLSLAALRSLCLRSVVWRAIPVLGQYEGFSGEVGAGPDTSTETFFAAYGKVMMKEWKGVYVTISAGKALATTDVAIYVHFKSSGKSAGKKAPPPLRIPINGYGIKEAHDEIFESALFGNKDRFADFAQIQASWAIVEKLKGKHEGKIKKSSKKKGNMVIYKRGSTPAF